MKEVGLYTPINMATSYYKRILREENSTWTQGICDCVSEPLLPHR